MANVIDWIQNLINRASKSLGWLGPLAARLVLAIIFIPSGWGKLHGLADVTDYFQSLGIPAPGFMALLASSTELVGGILILLGLFTRFASVGLFITMIIAIITAKRENIEGIFSIAGFEETHYAVLCVWLAVAGAGLLSLDRVLSKVWANRAARPVAQREAPQPR